MTRDDIIRMAREAGLIKDWMVLRDEDIAALDRFAAAEREACVSVVKAISDKYGWGYYGNEVDTADEIAAAIRARGQA